MTPNNAFWSAVWMQTDGANAHTTMPDGDVGVVGIHDTQSPTPASQRFLSNSPSSSGSVDIPQARQGNQGSDPALGTEQVPKGLPGLRSATSDAAARGPVPPEHGWLVDPMTV